MEVLTGYGGDRQIALAIKFLDSLDHELQKLFLFQALSITGSGRNRLYKVRNMANFRPPLIFLLTLDLDTLALWTKILFGLFLAEKHDSVDKNDLRPLSDPLTGAGQNPENQYFFILTDHFSTDFVRWYTKKTGKQC